jgi:hypothetical protein
MFSGAFLYLADGRLFVRCDDSGIRPATDADRRDAAQALRTGPVAALGDHSPLISAPSES